MPSENDLRYTMIDLYYALFNIFFVRLIDKKNFLVFIFTCLTKAVAAVLKVVDFLILDK